MDADSRPDRWGVFLVMIGTGLFVTSVVQNLVSTPDPYDLVQSGYVGVAALIVAVAGAWSIYDGWSASDRRRVFGWTILGGGFLSVLAFIALLDLQTTNVMPNLEADFFLLHFTTLGCLGGTTVGVYSVRTIRATRRATAERNRFETVLQNTPLPMITVDMDGVIDVWNEAAEETFGYDADEVKGRPTPLVPPDKREERDECLDRLRDGEDVEGFRTKRRRSDGTLLDVELWATPVPDPESGETYAVFVARDLTRVELLEQQRTVFERALRHNLRNELTIIRGYADHLATGERDDVSWEANLIREATDRLLSLSENVGRMERLDDAIESRDVNSCVVDVVEEISNEYPSASISVEATDDATVRAVPLLHDAIREAVENGVVHADVPEPEVSVTVREDEDGDYVHVDVADSGPGIPDSEWRPVENGTEGPLDHGSGLGLWVMQWAATSSGGHLSKTDSDPTGTVVTFTLPGSVNADDVPERYRSPGSRDVSEAIH